MFSKERVLWGRQVELDLVRGLSVFLMVGTHVFAQFGMVSSGVQVPEVASSFNITDLVGAFPGGAQCFMMVMGMLILFSTSLTWQMMVRRGFLLIGAGLFLEVVKLLPGLINLAISGDMVSFYPEYPFATDAQIIVITMFWTDILIFAGMAFLFLGLMSRFSVPDVGILAITAAMMVANVFLSGMDTGNDVLNVLLGYLWGTVIYDGTMTSSHFNFLSWIVYPVAGYLIAKLLVRANSKGRFYKTFGIAAFLLSVPLTVIGVVSGAFDGAFTGTPFYHQTALVNLWCMLLCFDWIALVYFASGRLPSIIVDNLGRWSRNITLIYVVHFAILAVLIQFLPASLGIIGCAVLFLVLFAAVDLLCESISRRLFVRDVPSD